MAISRLLVKAATPSGRFRLCKAVISMPPEKKEISSPSGRFWSSKAMPPEKKEIFSPSGRSWSSKAMPPEKKPFSSSSPSGRFWSSKAVVSKPSEKKETVDSSASAAGQHRLLSIDSTQPAKARTSIRKPNSAYALKHPAQSKQLHSLPIKPILKFMKDLFIYYKDMSVDFFCEHMDALLSQVGIKDILDSALFVAKVFDKFYEKKLEQKIEKIPEETYRRLVAEVKQVEGRVTELHRDLKVACMAIKSPGEPEVLDAKNLLPIVDLLREISQEKEKMDKIVAGKEDVMNGGDAGDYELTIPVKLIKKVK